MPLPRIAIVGRPNVGKSSLMNMIAGAKVSIVDPTPGVTRDRVSAIIDIEAPIRGQAPKPVEFTDTGGFGAYFEPTARFDEVGNDLRRLTRDIENQIAQAISGADLILFCIDTQAGITPADEHIARLLREQKLGKRQRTDGTLIPVQVVATKVDGPRWETHAHEFSALGFGLPLMCSSMNNYMRRDLLDALWEALPAHESAAAEKRSAQHADLKIAIIGKRNAGKSTLVNNIAGEERCIVSEIPGTTRDAIDVRVEKDGKTLVMVDTAGLRRKKSFQGQVEWYAFDRLQKAVDRADVVVVLIDATTKISQVDEQVAMLAQKAFKPVILAINKWDLAEGQPGRNGKPVDVEDYERYVRKEMKGLDFAPIAFLSGKNGLNVSETVNLAWELFEQTHQRISTGKLNRLFRKIVELRGPPSKVGEVAKVYYVAQTGTAPPTITLVVNYPELFTSTYQRFLINRLRENSDFVEIPIRLSIRDRKRTLQSERGQQPDLVDSEVGADVAEDTFRKDALLGMRAAARKAADAGAVEADDYFDEPLPGPRQPTLPKPAKPAAARVPRIDDDLDEAALEQALADMEIRALGEPEPDAPEGNFPAAAKDDESGDDGESDDARDDNDDSGDADFHDESAFIEDLEPVAPARSKTPTKPAAKAPAPRPSSPASHRNSNQPSTKHRTPTKSKPQSKNRPKPAPRAVAPIAKPTSGKPAAKPSKGPRAASLKPVPSRSDKVKSNKAKLEAKAAPSKGSSNKSARNSAGPNKKFSGKPATKNSARAGKPSAKPNRSAQAASSKSRSKPAGKPKSRR